MMKTEYEAPHLIESSYSKRMLAIDEDYKHQFTKDMALISELEPILNRACDCRHSNEGGKAVVQAMFDAGFIKVKSNDHNLTTLLQSIYGVKIAASYQKFKEAHQYLIEHDYCDHVGDISPYKLIPMENEGIAWCGSCEAELPIEQSNNGCSRCIQHSNQKRAFLSGDNYASAYSFDAAKVIIMEAQSAMWAVVYTCHRGHDLSLYKLRHAHTDKYRLPEFLSLIESGKMREFASAAEWRSYSNDPRYGLVTSVDLVRAEAVPVNNLGSIDQVLSMLHAVHCYTTL
ncbi:hypothetical protein LMH73_022290 [Vibrio splendidus]|nr:hypothetical protein [Vibrio splendidus]MCC4880497.1 hypothetical protein [Vibrio splendidus]